MALRALWDVTQQFQNKNGSNLTSGKIYIYYQGRTALATTYHDEDGTVVNSNPVLLDNNGRATAFADPIYSYTIVVCDYYGKELFSQDITLHDAISTAEDVVVIGSDGKVLVNRTELPNGVQYDLTVNTDIIATKEYVDGEVDNLQSQIDDKKDKQSALSFNGSATKTIKKITQNANGEMNVEFEDIDLPPEVPNVEITSPNGTIDVHSSTDVQTNTKTFTIDVERDNLQHFIGYYGKSRYEDRQPGPASGFWLYVDDWSNYTYDGDFITNNWQANNNPWFYVKPGLYMVHAVIYYEMNSDSANQNDTFNKDQYMRIYTGLRNGLEDGTRYKDWTHEYQLEENSIEVNFIRKVTGNSDNAIEICPEFPYGVHWACLHELQIVKLDSVVGGSGGGSTYTAGDGIDITNNEISVKFDNADVEDQDRNLDFGDTFGIADSYLTTGENGELVNEVTWQDVTLPTIKAGDGISFSKTGTETTISMNSDVSDVVQTVEKLKQDLDTQLTVNFDMPNVDNVYDFANPSVIGNLSNGAVMLCQAFTVPINHDIRVDDGETENPTLVGIYAKQAFTGKKIMLALYVYDFDTGYTDYVGDTGPVEVTQGRNEFPLVHINSNITELKSSCVYYATLYLPSNAHSNGLYLAGCPSYSNASYINATPRFTVGVENIVNPNTNQEIDMSNATTGRLDFNDGNGNYYIGPWSDNYNERPSIPRFFMQIRNGEVEEPIIVEPFTDIGSYTLKNTSSITDVFGSTITVNTSTYGAVFMEVTPAQDVDVTGWVCYDNYSIDDRQWYGQVFDANFENKLSDTSNGTISELGETSTGSGIYGHEFTRSTALHLTANTTYRFLVGIPHSNNDLLVQYNTPTNEKTLHLFESGYNVSQWVTYSRANNVQGIDFLIKDANHEWRI